MKYEERRFNLFEMDEKYYLAQCVSVDLKMGAGIAVDFAKKFPAIKQLRNQPPRPVGSCAIVGRVLNLITKKVYYGKPTYITFTSSLTEMKKICIEQNIKFIAMPKIGCGLDRLSWGKVREIIQEIFADTDIEIVVCSL